MSNNIIPTVNMEIVSASIVGSIVDSIVDSDVTIDTDSDMEIDSTYFDGEFEEESSTQQSTQTESPYCDICYVDLTFDNIVTSTCNHQFCNTCFFRWIEVNATCPSCRAPVNSNTNLTAEQFQRESDTTYREYTRLLTRYSHLIEDNQIKIVEMYNTQEKTNALLRRQISLREQMRETEGYNEGYMTAAYKFFHGNKNMKDSDLLRANRDKRGFMNGYQAGIDIESRRLNKMAKKFKQITKKKVTLKKRKIQKTLWDYGITNTEDFDPLDMVS